MLAKERSARNAIQEPCFPMNEELNRTEARQGVTGHKVRYVLGISTALVVALFVIIYFVFAAG